MKLNVLLIMMVFLYTVACTKESLADSSDDSSDTDTTATSLDIDLTKEELLDFVQEETFKYFWDYAEPNSGAARERYLLSDTTEDENLVTTGGSGFGLMALIVGVERGFITAEEGYNRISTIINFFENADRFHGAWPHWLDGASGKVVPFSDEDNGGDIVETSYLAQALIIVYEYYKDGDEEDTTLAYKAKELWKGIEWNWYTNNKDVLYWHWSPDYEFDIGLEINGYNECLISYILAASSPDYPITKEVYDNGWAGAGDIVSSNSKYGYSLIVTHVGSEEYGGPLFWSHYSFLGLNPYGLEDEYVNYWDAVVNHAKINYSYCVKNPLGYRDYDTNCWGLTSSYSLAEDGSLTYVSHQPSNDKGIIAPTAALSSMPYTPDKSFNVLTYLYYLKSYLLGDAGFYDAFSPENNYWVAKAYLAIDQGPIIIMIENYRTGLLWKYFMQNQDVKAGLDLLGFSYEME